MADQNEEKRDEENVDASGQEDGEQPETEEGLPGTVKHNGTTGSVDSEDSDDSETDEETEATGEGQTKAADEAGSVAHRGAEESSDTQDDEETDDGLEVAEEGVQYDVDAVYEDVASRENIDGIAAFFDHPDELMGAARATRDERWEKFDAYSPFPIHGMDEAMGLGRSWIPWVTFTAAMVGFVTANALQFGMMTFDWPMNIGGKPFAPWPSFVPIMFELSVLLGGVTTAIVMLIAAGCFQKAKIIDPGISDDRFALWIAADDSEFESDAVIEFMKDLDPVEIKAVAFDQNEGSVNYEADGHTAQGAAPAADLST